MSLNNPALLYQAQGHYAKAEPLYQRSLAIWEKVLGPAHPYVATSLENYAALLRETARAMRQRGWSRAPKRSVPSINEGREKAYNHGCRMSASGYKQTSRG